MTNRLQRIPVIFPFLVLFLSFQGCGYTRKSVLPEGVKTLYVDTVKNAIPIDQVYAYEPGLEMKITNALVRRLNKDGNLRVTERKEADAVLETKLIRFEQEGLRFNNLESVEEYRLFIVVAMRLVNAKTGRVIWEEPNFSGDSEYFVSGVRSLGRGEAADRAVNQLARNIVDRIVEDW